MSNSDNIDDEFDDLFSFGTTPTPAVTAGTKSSSPISFSLDDDDDDNNDGTDVTESKIQTNPNSFAVSSNSLSSESFFQVSATAGDSTPSPTSEDDDDVFGEARNHHPAAGAVLQTKNDSLEEELMAAADNVTLGALRKRLPSEQEEDFHQMDSGTREFLDWLDKPGGDGDNAATGGGGGSDGNIEGSLDMDMDMDLDLDGTGIPVKNTLDDDFDFEKDILEEKPQERSFVEINTSPTTGEHAGMTDDVPDRTAGTNMPRTLSSTKSADLVDIDVSGAGVSGDVDATSGNGDKSDDVIAESSTEKKNQVQEDAVKFKVSKVDIQKTEEELTTSKDEVSKDTSTDDPTSNKLQSTNVSEEGDMEMKDQSIQQSNTILAESSSTEEEQQGTEGTLLNQDQHVSNTVARLPSSDSCTTATAVPPKKELTFQNLKEALYLHESTMEEHIRPLLQQGNQRNAKCAVVSDQDRPWLYSKAILGKPLSEIQTSSLADSFVNWDKKFDLSKFENEQESCMDDIFMPKILEDAKYLSRRIELGQTIVQESRDDAVGESKEENIRRELCSLLLFHYQQSNRGKDDSHDQPTEAVSKAETNANNIAEDESATASKEESAADTEKVCQAGEGDEKKNDMDSKPETAHASDKNTMEYNPFLAPIAATLLSASVPTPVASVMLSTIAPVAMPLVSLTQTERLAAVKTLHRQLYLLANYHLPLLVLHLDRYAPGWHWPKKMQQVVMNTNQESASDKETDSKSKVNDISRDFNEKTTSNVNQGESYYGNATKKGRNLEDHGVIPMTWFISYLAGECNQNGSVTAEITTMKPKHLLALWDVLLTSNDRSLVFFLALAVLEKHSDSLLMLRGKDLVEELNCIMSFQKSNSEEESFVGDDEHYENDFDDLTNDASTKVEASGDNVSSEEWTFIRKWCERAKCLSDSTPRSVVEQLAKAEDEAINHALVLRHKITMEKMQSRLEAEAKIHREAIEAKKLKEDMEAKNNMYKKRLEAFYLRKCPEKVDKVDDILKIYEGRLPLLDKRLKAKYGSGFLPVIPVINPNLTAKTNKLFSTMGHGIQSKRKNLVALRAEEEKKRLENELKAFERHQVAHKVACREILPTLCGSKVVKMSPRGSEPLKYYLVDSRPDETAMKQGRFPTAVRLSPEALMDPDRIQQQVEMFESFRGAVHICIMGEGFSSFPSLFDHSITKTNEQLLKEDESRTSICALFFIKRGFPFVSILDGGFAGAHAWLSREGPSHSLSLNSVLVDYDENKSVFAELESVYREQQKFATASTREKTTLVIQKLIDNSMTRLAMSENRIDDFADRFRSQEGRDKVKQSVTKLFSKQPSQSQLSNEEKDNTEQEKPFKISFPGFKNVSGKAEVSHTNGNADTKNQVMNDNSQEQTTEVISKDEKSFKMSFPTFGKNAINEECNEKGGELEENKTDQESTSGQENAKQSYDNKEKTDNPFKISFSTFASLKGKEKLKQNLNETQSESVREEKEEPSQGGNSNEEVVKVAAFDFKRILLSRSDSKEHNTEKEKTSSLGLDEKAEGKKVFDYYDKISFSGFKKQSTLVGTNEEGEKDVTENTADSKIKPASSFTDAMKRNLFAKKVSKVSAEDAELENEIYASTKQPITDKQRNRRKNLFPPVNVPGFNSSNEKTAKTNKSEKSHKKSSFNATLNTMPFKKFGSLTNRKPLSNVNQTTEESIIFENTDQEAVEENELSHIPQSDNAEITETNETDQNTM